MNDLFQELYALHTKRWRVYKEETRIHLIRVNCLHPELIGMLLRKNGEISYKTMETNLGGFVSINAIRRHVQILEIFKHRKSRLFPQINNAEK